MSLINLGLIAHKEVRDSLRNRWFWLYAIAFAVLSLGLSWLSLAGTESAGFAGFGRTTAGLVSLVLLIVPLMALNIGAASIAGERERGTLAYLLSQPVTRCEVLLGKYLGLAAALLAALAAGFGLSGGVIAWYGGGGSAGSYVMLVLLTFVLALAMLSVGLLVSVLARRTAVAVGVAIMLWLLLAFGTDLALMGSTIRFNLRADELMHLRCSIRYRCSRCGCCWAFMLRSMCWAIRRSMHNNALAPGSRRSLPWPWRCGWFCR